MDILALNPAFCMRAYHQFKALSEKGFGVHLRYLGHGDSLKNVDDSFLRSKERIFSSDHRLSHFPRTLMPGSYRKAIGRYIGAGEFDLIMVHNMPDILGVAAKRYSDLPVIFDERDMVTAFQKDAILANYIPKGYLGLPLVRSLGMATVYTRLSSIEREAIEGSDGRTWVSDHTLDLARDRYDVPQENNLVFYNYAGKDDIRPPKDKLSSSDGETHIVYEGVLASSGYRAPLLDVFKRIAGMGIHIHIYGLGDAATLEEYKGNDDGTGHFHFHGPVPHDILMEEMTAYDWGIVPFDPPATERDHYDTMLPNKFFDYLVCGLPVLAPRSRSMAEFIGRTGVGGIYEVLEDIPGLVQGRRPKVVPQEHTIEEHIDDLVALIGAVTRGRRG